MDSNFLKVIHVRNVFLLGAQLEPQTSASGSALSSILWLDCPGFSVFFFFSGLSLNDDEFSGMCNYR